VTNVTTDAQRLWSRITRADVENASEMRQHQQQQHDEALDSKPPYCSQAITFTSVAPPSANSHSLYSQFYCHRQGNDQSHHEQQNLLLFANAGEISSMENTRMIVAGDHHHHPAQQQQQQQQQQPITLEQLNTQPFSCSNTTASTERCQPADEQLFYHHHQQHQHQRRQQKNHEQVDRLQNLQLRSVNYSDAVRPVLTEKSRMADEQFGNNYSLERSRHHRQRNYHNRQQQLQQQLGVVNVQPPLSCSNSAEKGPTIDQQLLRHHHRHKQPLQHKERQQNASANNYNSLMTMSSSSGFAHTTVGDTTLPRTRIQSTRRGPPPPPPTGFLPPTQSNPLLRTATVSDGPPMAGETVTLLRGQVDGNNFHISTLPRVKLHTTNGNLPQGRTILSIPARPVQPINGLAHRSQSHRPATLEPKSSRDRFQFFSRNELAAAAAAGQAMNNSSAAGSSCAQKRTAESKTNWFRRVLFK